MQPVPTRSQVLKKKGVVQEYNKPKPTPQPVPARIDLLPTEDPEKAIPNYYSEDYKSMLENAGKYDSPHLVFPSSEYLPRFQELQTVGGIPTGFQIQPFRPGSVQGSRQPSSVAITAVLTSTLTLSSRARRL